MDADSWSSRLSSASKHYQSTLQSRSDMFMGFEEFEADDDIRDEYHCPFCSEYFDIVGLCCHIDDEHPVEAKTGICPICATRVGVDMVAHITLQHGNIFKICSARENREKGGSHSTLALLRRELREGNLKSLFGGSSYLNPSTNVSPDPLLSSFILPMADDYGCSQSHSLAELTSIKKSTTDSVPKRSIQSSPLSIKDQEEGTRRSEFVQGMLLSTILDNL